MRPCLFAGPAREISVFSPVTRWDFYCVSHCINIFIAGLHLIVYDDAAPLPQCQARFFCKGTFRRNAKGKDHHVCLESARSFQLYADFLICICKATHRLP